MSSTALVLRTKSPESFLKWSSTGRRQIQGELGCVLESEGVPWWVLPRQLAGHGLYLEAKTVLDGHLFQAHPHILYQDELCGDR